MSLLLNLPNEVCISVIHEWINDNSYYCWLLLDSVMNINANLRVSLLRHFSFVKNCSKYQDENSFTEIHFNWLKGFYCSEVVYYSSYDRSWHNQIQPIYHSIYISSEYFHKVTEVIAFINSSREVHKLSLDLEAVISYLNPEIMSSLTFLEMRYPCELMEAGFWIATHCRNLIGISCSGKRFWNSSNDIIANNRNLNEIILCANRDTFNIIPVSCKQIYNVVLSVTSMYVKLSSIVNMIDLIPTLTNYRVEASEYEFVWVKQSNSAKITAEWTFNYLEQRTLAEFIQHGAAVTTSLSLKDTYGSIATELLANVIQSCASLEELILFNFSNTQLIAMTKHSFANLTTLKVESQVDVLTIVTIIKQCTALQECMFDGFTDTSTEEPSVVSLLRNTLIESQLTLFYIQFLQFDDKLRNKHFHYRCKHFIAIDMNHFLNLDKAYKGENGVMIEQI